MGANAILALVLQGLAMYREARDRQAKLDARSGVPDDPTTPEREDFKTDAELAVLLGSDAHALQAHADELLEKYRT